MRKKKKKTFDVFTRLFKVKINRPAVLHVPIRVVLLFSFCTYHLRAFMHTYTYLLDGRMINVTYNYTYTWMYVVTVLKPVILYVVPAYAHVYVPLTDNANP